MRGYKEEQLTCDYLTDRWAKIYIEDFAGPLFELKAGVPQGGCLSPTLFSMYTAEIPEPETRNSIDIYYADDVTQLISYQTKSERLLAIKFFYCFWEVKVKYFIL